MTDAPFWAAKPLDALTPVEWEALCDGCGRCCLHKLEDEDSGDVVYTAVACRLLDVATCRCTDYPARRTRVPACLDLGRASGRDFLTLPPTCAYRLRWLGQPLPDWHPLVSGDPDSVHRAGISVRGRAVSERDYGDAIDTDAPLFEPD